MTKVSELVSQNVSSAVTNYNTWGNLAVNVKSYGAKGDWNVSTSIGTDDTIAIQAAITYAISLGKKEVYFPAGTYKYTTLTSTSGMTFIGDGVTLVGTTAITLTSIALLSADIALQWISVLHYGAIGDGVADDTAAIQAALDAAPAGSTILIGNHRLHGALNITKSVKLKGSMSKNGNDAGGASLSRLYFDSGQATCISSTANLFLEEVIITGTSVSVGIGINVSTNSLVLEHVTIQEFGTGVKVSGGYYCKIENSYIGFCNNDIIFDNCYNINAVGLSLNANTICIQLLNGSTMRMMGGSIEGFASYGASLTVGSKLDLFGTYFEGGSAATGFGVNLGNDCSVVAIGTHAYLTAIPHFINAGGATGVNIYSRSNKFVYSTTAFTSYVYTFDVNVTNNYVDIAGDNWNTSAGAGVAYIDGTVFGAQLAQSGIYMIQFPANHPNFGQDIYTQNGIQALTKVTPSTPKVGTIITVLNNGYGTDDPLGIHGSSWGYNPYKTIYQKGQWEKLGARIPNQANTSGATLAQLETEVNTLKTNLRANGIMI